MSDPSTVDKPTKEPVFNAPWPIVALVGVLIATHALRMVTGAPPDRYAFTDADLAAGRWGALATYQFVHGSWIHAGLNAVAVLAFGAPTARLMGLGARGSAAFLAFFLVCGVLSALGYAALHQAGGWALIGASGAASGLMGAAARLIQGHGRVGPLFGRTVIGMSAAWIIVNVLFGLSGLTPGAAGVPVAWEAHILGFFAGLFLVGPFAWLAGGDRAARSITD